MSARDEIRDRLADALASAPDGCWDYEDCCYSALGALLPVVEEAVAAARAEVLTDAAMDLHIHRFDRETTDEIGGPDTFYRGVQWCRDRLRALAEESRR